MAKGSKLKLALDNFKGVDHKQDHQKKLQKNAEKRKRAKVENEEEGVILEQSIAEAGKATAPPPAKKSKKNKAQRQAKRAQANKVENPVSEDEDALIEAALEDEEESDAEEQKLTEEDWESEDSEEVTLATNLARLAEDSSDSEEDEEDIQANGGAGSDSEDEDEDEEMGTDDEDEDIALSDLDSVASEDKEDIIPYQRLTINNTAALTKAYKSFALSSKLPFSENQVVVSEAPTEIEDVEDDLNRELAFYKQSLEALHRARGLLKKEGVAFSRPVDYFAEMVKDDEQMGKIKQKLIDDAAGKRASADARRQRDLKKFGKQVQVAKLQERDRTKRDTMEKINLLKRKRQGADIGNATEADLFDVALEDSAVTAKKDRKDRKEKSGAGRPNHKRAGRDEKYGFGGKKRFAKSNDATSAADVSKYSVKKMKGGKKGAASRPGKSRRAART